MSTLLLLPSHWRVDILSARQSPPISTSANSGRGKAPIEQCAGAYPRSAVAPTQGFDETSELDPIRPRPHDCGMDSVIHLRVLSANHVTRPGLLAEHGLAVWIDTGAHRILWDTGQGLCLKHNAKRMGIDLAALDGVILSHGHYDHTGGLPLTQAPVYCHPAALEPRYSRKPDGSVRPVGIPQPLQLRAVTLETGPSQPFPGLHLTGEIPRGTDYEDTGGRFFLDVTATQPDHLPDDQALYVDTPKGLVVLLGCAHAGVINTLEFIVRQTGRPIRAVLGGMHLVKASPERIERTIEALRVLDPALLLPGHCTGTKAEQALRQAFGNSVISFEVGADFTF